MEISNSAMVPFMMQDELPPTGYTRFVVKHFIIEVPTNLLHCLIKRREVKAILPLLAASGFFANALSTFASFADIAQYCLDLSGKTEKLTHTFEPFNVMQSLYNTIEPVVVTQLVQIGNAFTHALEPLFVQVLNMLEALYSTVQITNSHSVFNFMKAVVENVWLPKLLLDVSFIAFRLYKNELYKQILMKNANNAVKCAWICVCFVAAAVRLYCVAIKPNMGEWIIYALLCASVLQPIGSEFIFPKQQHRETMANIHYVVDMVCLVMLVFTAKNTDSMNCLLPIGYIAFYWLSNLIDDRVDKKHECLITLAVALFCTAVASPHLPVTATKLLKIALDMGSNKLRMLCICEDIAEADWESEKKKDGQNA